MELGVIDGIVLEPGGGAHEDHDEAARMLGESLSDALDDIRDVPGDELKRLRRRKFRELGVYV
jgi:acetyl-CoA carboxylase alpha subunit